jgi:hypothetical protein
LASGFFEIRDSSGRMLLPARGLNGGALPLDVKTLKAVSTDPGRAILKTVSASSLNVRRPSADFRLLTYLTKHADWREPLILQIAVPMDLPRQEQRDLLTFFALAIPGFMLVCGLAGVWMSKPALRPVHDMTLKAQLITGVEKLKERIPVPAAHDEIHELAETFNGLLDRLEKAFASQDRFVSNASHQLKTPLTILKGELDLLRKSQDASAAELGAGLDSAATEIDRLIQLVQDLLLLARLEAGRDTISLSPVRVDEAMMSVVARLQKLARNKNVQLNFRVDDEGLDAEVQGDIELLESMLENFIENAIKYSPANSVIELGLTTADERVRVSVRDHGPGVPAELRQKVFERFQRVLPSNIIPGSGLGLSIAAEIARIHGVEIDLQSAVDGGGGTVVLLTFPHSRLTQPGPGA